MTLSPSELNPLEVQKIVVEHIVRSEDKPSHSHSTLRLRAFSGKIPRPYSEVDYDAWRSHVDLMMKDFSISDLEKTRKILESLLIPASDVVRHLGPEAPPTAYLQMLDSAFATVEEVEELFLRFMNTFQDSGENPSSYLQRLQVSLCKAVRRGGVPAQDVDSHLLRQFCRGCWDNVLLKDLCLEHKKQNPPSFAELLMLLRTEEERQEAKAMRMKQHLGTTKQKAVSHVQTVCNCGETQAEPDTSSINELRKQVADLKSQLTSFMKKKRTVPPKRETSKVVKTQKPDHATTETNLTSHKGATSRPKPWYCFRCGEDGHVVATCESDANPALVAAKRKELRRQQLWEAQNTPTFPLN
ncbi:paraneoplastic antigen Ma1-like [Perca flavescens]|uniref:paraneoplastic antigen Ma1-like n=1 Tax=Perca flavescens TaxID=8167 RepID=UPI00106E7546|nr:paraneoplastic antigen Ma1-like [Perca flavescens]